MANFGRTIGDTSAAIHPIGAIGMSARFQGFKDMVAWVQGINTGDTDNGVDFYHNNLGDDPEGWRQSRADLLRIINNLGAVKDQFYHDTSLGGNVAINCYWSFTRDDDIVPPMFAAGDGSATVLSDDPVRGMGRVYHEMYHNTGQLLHLIMGSPNYSSIGGYLRNTGSRSVGDILFGSDAEGIIKKMGRYLANTGEFLIKLPFIPFQGISAVLTAARDFAGISKFVSFTPNMAVYYRMVNTILHELAAGMGLGMHSWYENASDSSVRIHQLYKALGYPRIMQEGIDIIQILSRRYRRKNPNAGPLNLDELIENTSDIGGLGSTLTNIASAMSVVYEDEEADQDEEGTPRYKGFNSYIPKSPATTSKGANFIDAALSGYQYVTFRVTANENSSHSSSNQLGESTLGAKLKQKSVEHLDELVSPGIGSLALGPIRTGIELARKAAEIVQRGLGFSTVADAMYHSGFHDIPEVWKGAQFSKTYTFSMTLKSPLGDNASIMQAEYAPLALLLAASFPRQINRNMYSSPFYVRGSCKGQFAFALGMFESISITPGSGGRNWSINMLPTSIDIQFTIRDLTPVIAVGLCDSKLPILNILNHNSAFHEYLATLSGVGFRERFNLLPQLRRSILARWADTKTTYSPSTIGAKLGMSWFGQTVGSFLPLLPMDEILSRE